jgi:hypothetical protein
MDIIENYPQGHWTVGDKKFINKYQALLYSTEINVPVKFVYFDSVYQNFDRAQIGKFTLQELYKQRARQLRDSYDYLILYFSGGADSWNVLKTFIDNNIHIDEVCVKWCSETVDNNIYIPNITDLTANNYLSEWDLAIKPVLKWLAVAHPKIKIEIVNWFEDRESLGKEEVFKLVNHWHDVEVPSLAVWSPNEKKLLEQGVKVGSIYGVDKPQTYLAPNNKWYMYFVDSATTMGTPNPDNVFGTEYFYWTPNMPELVFEQAAVVIKAFKSDPILMAYAYTSKIKTNKHHEMACWQYQQKALRSILYDNWINAYQAYKPQEVDRSDKHWWLYKYSELAKFKDGYRDTISLHTAQLRDDLYIKSSAGATMYKNCISAVHFVSSNMED